MVRTPGFHPGNRGFDSHRDHHFLLHKNGDEVGMRTHDSVRRSRSRVKTEKRLRFGFSEATP